MKNYRLNQVSIRLVENPPLLGDEPLNTPEAAVKILSKEFHDFDREVVCIVNLQADLRPINMNLVTIGALSSAMVHPREIFKSAILSNAESIIMAHNHPSGSLEPSKYDQEVTARIKKSGELLGIHLLDHVILGKNGEFYSIMENRKNQILHQDMPVQVDNKR